MRSSKIRGGFLICWNELSRWLADQWHPDTRAAQIRETPQRLKRLTVGCLRFLAYVVQVQELVLKIVYEVAPSYRKRPEIDKLGK